MTHRCDELSQFEQVVGHDRRCEDSILLEDRSRGTKCNVGSFDIKSEAMVVSLYLTYLYSCGGPAGCNEVKSDVSTRRTGRCA